MEAQSGKRSLPTATAAPEMKVVKHRNPNPGPDSTKALAIPAHPQRAHLRRRTQMSPWHNFAALTFPRTLLVTSLFAMKRNKAVWVGQRKPPAAMSDKPGVICFCSFPCDCWRVSWFLLAQTSPLSKDNSLKSSGKLTWLNLALGWPPHALRIKRT